METLEAIRRKIQNLKTKANAIASKETAKVVSQIQDIMEKHGLTVSHIDAHLGGKRRGRPPASGHPANVAGKSKGKLPPKYINPKTGETWSAHGRPPQWIAGVRDRTKFLIDANAVGANETVDGKAKATPKDVRGDAAKTKGKLPPKYRDPKSGATWSGHARPPAWIAEAKDRTKFLIAGTTDVRVAGNGASKANVGKQGDVVMKTVSKKRLAKKAPAANKSGARKVLSPKAPAKKQLRTTVAVTVPVGTVESGAGSTT